MVTLEKLAPYLPYKLKVQTGKNVIRIMSMDNMYRSFPKQYCSINNLINGIGHKLVLRPLSDLTEIVEHEGKMIVPAIEMAKNYGLKNPYFYNRYENNIGLNCVLKGEEGKMFFINNPIYTYFAVSQLFKYHFDFLGMIESGDAIDINTLNK